MVPNFAELCELLKLCAPRMDPPNRFNWVSLSSQTIFQTSLPTVVSLLSMLAKRRESVGGLRSGDFSSFGRVENI